MLHCNREIKLLKLKANYNGKTKRKHFKQL